MAKMHSIKYRRKIVRGSKQLRQTYNPARIPQGFFIIKNEIAALLL